MKRRFLWIGVLVLVAIGGVAGLRSWLEEPPGVSREIFRRLHEGMPKERVFVLLGDSSWCVDLSSVSFTNPTHAWSDDDFLVSVSFDKDGRLTEGCLIPRKGGWWVRVVDLVVLHGSGTGAVVLVAWPAGPGHPP